MRKQCWNTYGPKPMYESLYDAPAFGSHHITSHTQKKGTVRSAWYEFHDVQEPDAMEVASSSQTNWAPPIRIITNRMMWAIWTFPIQTHTSDDQRYPSLRYLRDRRCEWFARIAVPCQPAVSTLDRHEGEYHREWQRMKGFSRMISWTRKTVMQPISLGRDGWRNERMIKRSIKRKERRKQQSNETFPGEKSRLVYQDQTAG